jgi:hypothetical protein
MKPLTDEQDQYRLVCHEIGHHLCATAFRIPSSPRVLAAHERYKEADGGTVGADCALGRAGTPFAQSTIGFSGVVAEILCNASALDVCLPLQKCTARAWHYIVEANMDYLSLSDRIMICSYKHRWLTFRAAHRILSRNKRALLKLARDAKPQASPPAPLPEPVDDPPLPFAPLPEKWPASNMDFVRLVVEPSGLSGVESFDRFGACRLPRLGSFAALSKYFVTCLQDQAGWQRLARDFFRWARDNPLPNQPQAHTVTESLVSRRRITQ